MNDIGNDLAQRFTRALHDIDGARDGAVEQMAALFADSATLSNPALDHAGNERRGRDGARAFWNGYADAFSGATTTFSHVTFGEGAIGLFWRTTGGSSPVGDQRLDYAGSTLLEHDESGAITRFCGYYDTQALKTTVAPG